MEQMVDEGSFYSHFSLKFSVFLTEYSMLNFMGAMHKLVFCLSNVKMLFTQKREFFALDSYSHGFIKYY